MWENDFVAGVDGCKTGWMCFKLYGSGNAEPELMSLVDVIQSPPKNLRALAIDIPIGLLDGPRACDVAARKLLGFPRRSSVFPPPCRAALVARDHKDMCRINQGVTGKKVTLQSYSIAPKIREVDDAITLAAQSWVFEVHPEVCFWHFSGSRAMQHKKKSHAGREERIRVLADYLPRIAEHLASRPTGVAVDDLLDAAVAALTARRWLHGEAVRVCEPQQDGRGLRTEIVY